MGQKPSIPVIPVQNVGPLCIAIHEDFPTWDGRSSTLSSYFKTRKIDPTRVYAEYYVNEEPTLAASYVWAETDLLQIAGLLLAMC